VSNRHESFPAFCEQPLRQPLWPHQEEAASADAFITTIAAARRTGKTELAENLALWTMFKERGVKVLILSATEDASRERPQPRPSGVPWNPHNDPLRSL
jgi:hypothetical protein